MRGSMTKIIGVAAVALSIAGPAWPADEAHEPPEHDWSFSGVFGTFDQAQLQRGFQVYSQICVACHSLKYVAYRHLEALGYNEAEIAAIAAEAQLEDGPNDAGDMFMRAGRASDFFVSPYANDNQARAFNGGALPPDLSLITKARQGGPDYIFGLLTGFEDEAPAGVEIAPGLNYNEYFPGNLIAMFPPLRDGAVDYADGTEPTLAQTAEDVTAFLVWAAEPELVERKRMGFKVIIFLIILAGLSYATKRRVWKDLH